MDTRQLLRHVQQVRGGGGGQTCLEAMNKTLAEFKTDLRRQRETAWVGNNIELQIFHAFCTEKEPA